MAKCILELNGVRVSFADRLVLDLDHFSVYDGDRIGLIGENGAGKTTLLRVLSGELTPEAGQVRRLSPVAMIRQQGDSDAGDDAETALNKARGQYGRVDDAAKLIDPRRE